MPFVIDTFQILFAVADAELTLQRSRSLDVQRFGEFLTSRALASDTLNEHYVRTTTHHVTAHPIHRKLKLSAYIRKQRADKGLVARLKSIFGEDAVFVMGNWSAPHTKYHEPIKGIGFRRLLKKNDFTVFLMDEFRTSRCCPICQNISLETFKRVQNPRPYRRQAIPEVIRHGLLRCANQNYREVMNRSGFDYRLWNRDLAACLDMIEIVYSLRFQGVVPAIFQRGTAAPTKGRGKRRQEGDQQEDQQRIRPRLE